MPEKLALPFDRFQNDQVIRDGTLVHGVIESGAPPAQLAVEPAGAPPSRPMLEPTPTVLASAAPVDELGGARAIEVAALLGDSVIAVKHCIDPRSGKVMPATWGVLAAGVACLLASALGFAASVSTAADNERRLDAWLGAGKPARAFRPVELGAGIDWLAFGGLALGLAGLTAGLARARRERIHPYYRIGTAPGVELAVENAPSTAFPLIAPSGDDFVFNYSAGIDGELIVGGAAIPLAELAVAGRSRPSAAIAGAIEVPIPPAARIRARAGQTTFVISAVPRPRRHAAPLLAGLDRRALSYFAGSLAVHLAVLALLQLLPLEAYGINLTLDGSETARTRSGTVARIEAPPEKLRDPGGGSSDGAEAASMALPSGAAGHPDAAQSDGRMRVARTQDRPQLSREQAIERARHEGILGSDALLAGIQALAAHDPFTSGFDDEHVHGRVAGGDGGAWGPFGAGRHGAFAGGGCTEEPCGTIGTGRYLTINTGARTGDSFWFPGGRGPGGSGRNPILPRIGEPTTIGPSYDKAIVRRYIRRHIDEIGYCYDKQLLARPGIQGAITVTFLISPVGNVQSASATGFDGEVARCLAAVIRNIDFPAPRDGGVQVSYPFHFRAPAP